MADAIILVCLLVLCLGQVVALFKGRLAAVTYYLCVAPVEYFAVWRFGTWDAARVCGVIVIVGSWLIYPRRARDQRLASPFFVLLVLYGVVATLIGWWFWPTDAFAGVSPVYGKLRAVVQIVGWLIMLGMAWNIALAFAEPGSFEKAQPAILLTGVVLCLYAYYQTAASRFDWPATGIRSPVALATGEMTEERTAGYTLAGTSVFRPGSLVGEPKGLGFTCVFWLALVLSRWLTGRVDIRLGVALLVVVGALWLTASTSAWGGALACLGVTAFYGLLTGAGETGNRQGLSLAALGVLAACAVGVLFLVYREDVADIYEQRWSSRVVDPLSDAPEKTSLEVLADQPYLALWGTGLGGMSFYIARRSTELEHMIFFPNNGLLGFVCNVGAMGLILLFLSVQDGLLAPFRGRGPAQAAQALAVVGLAALLQCFIFAGSWLMSAAIGCLLAAGACSRNSVTDGPE